MLPKILQDEHGFMWFGTEVGTDKYDGSEFILIDGFKQNLSDEITLLFENKEKHYILVGTEEVLYTIDCHSNEAKQVTNSKKNIIHAFNGQSDELILFSQDTIFKFINNTVTPFYGFEKDSFTISSVIKHSENDYILGTNNGLYQFFHKRHLFKEI